MLDTLRMKLVELRGKVEDYERLATRLAQLEQSLTDEASRLPQVKEQLLKEFREIQGRLKDVGRRPAAGQAANAKPAAHLSGYEQVRQEKVRDAVQKTVAELADLQNRLAHLALAKAERSMPVPHEETAAAEPLPIAAPAPPPHAEPAPPAPHPAAAAEPPAAEPAAHEPAAETPKGESRDEPPRPTAETVTAEEAASREDEKTVLETLETGRRTLRQLDHCLELSKEIAHKGAWHAVVGAVSRRSPDRAALAEAFHAAKEARDGLRQFHLQVADVRRQFGDRVNLGEAAAAVEPILEALAGGADKPHPDADVHRLLDMGRHTYHEVRAVCARLQLEANRLRAERVRQGFRRN